MKMRKLLDFICVTSLIVINNKSKVVHFCLHTRYHVTCIFTHPISKILISCGQQNYLGKLICVCNINCFFHVQTKKSIPTKVTVLTTSSSCLLVQQHMATRDSCGGILSAHSAYTYWCMPLFGIGRQHYPVWVVCWSPQQHHDTLSCCHLVLHHLLHYYCM